MGLLLREKRLGTAFPENPLSNVSGVSLFPNCLWHTAVSHSRSYVLCPFEPPITHLKHRLVMLTADAGLDDLSIEMRVTS